MDSLHPSSVELAIGDGERLEIENDYVFFFAGGVPPFGFLEHLGISFGGQPAAADL